MVAQCICCLPIHHPTALAKGCQTHFMTCRCLWQQPCRVAASPAELDGGARQRTDGNRPHRGNPGRGPLQGRQLGPNGCYQALSVAWRDEEQAWVGYSPVLRHELILSEVLHGRLRDGGFRLREPVTKVPVRLQEEKLDDHGTLLSHHEALVANHEELAASYKDAIADRDELIPNRRRLVLHCGFRCSWSRLANYCPTQVSS